MIILLWFSVTFVPKGPIEYAGSDNGLALNWRQAITWSNADPDPCRIYAALAVWVDIGSLSLIVAQWPILREDRWCDKVQIWVSLWHKCDIEKCTIFHVQNIRVVYDIIGIHDKLFAL